MSEESEDFEYLSYGSHLMYLGKSGVTVYCVDAMIAILTSAFRPEKITMVLGPHEDGSESVLFLVWHWLAQGLESDVTIVPDGFGTHGGEGGAGLSNVLGLLRFYGIPLFQARIHDEEAFNKLAEGTLTEETFHLVQAARPYSWNFYPVSEVKKVKKKGTTYLEIWWNGRFDFDVQLPE